MFDPTKDHNCPNPEICIRGYKDMLEHKTHDAAGNEYGRLNKLGKPSIFPQPNTLNLDQEIVLSCAFRYALGRMTYVVSSVASQIELNIHALTDKTIRQFYLEIKEAIGRQAAGMKMDVERWVQCQFVLISEYERRYGVEATRELINSER